MRKGQVGDEIDGKLFEREGRGGLNGRERRGHRVCANLVLLANGTTGDEVIDEYRKSWPPKIVFNNGFGAKTSKVAREGRGVDGVKQRGPSRWWYIHAALIVEVAIVKSPVDERRTGKERGTVR